MIASQTSGQSGLGVAKNKQLINSPRREKKMFVLNTQVIPLASTVTVVCIVSLVMYSCGQLELYKETENWSLASACATVTGLWTSLVHGSKLASNHDVPVGTRTYVMSPNGRVVACRCDNCRVVLPRRVPSSLWCMVSSFLSSRGAAAICRPVVVVCLARAPSSSSSCTHPRRHHRDSRYAVTSPAVVVPR